MVLLCGCLVLGTLQPKEEWDFVEVFAAKTGACIASYEISYGKFPRKKRHPGRSSQQRNSMDFNGESGFALFGMLLNSLFVFASYEQVTKLNRLVGRVGSDFSGCIQNQLFQMGFEQMKIPKLENQQLGQPSTTRTFG